MAPLCVPSASGFADDLFPEEDPQFADGLPALE